MKSGSRLERILKAGHFAVTGELGPPNAAILVDPELLAMLLTSLLAVLSCVTSVAADTE